MAYRLWRDELNHWWNILESFIKLLEKHLDFADV